MGDLLAGWMAGWAAWAGCWLSGRLGGLAGQLGWRAMASQPFNQPGGPSCLFFFYFQNLQPKMAKRKALGPHSNPFCPEAPTCSQMLPNAPKHLCMTLGTRATCTYIYILRLRPCRRPLYFGLLFFWCFFLISLLNFVLVRWSPDVVSMSGLWQHSPQDRVNKTSTHQCTVIALRLLKFICEKHVGLWVFGSCLFFSSSSEMCAGLLVSGCWFPVHICFK